MAKVSKRILNKNLEEHLFTVFIESIINLRNKEDVKNFIADILSPVEKIMLTKRLAIAILLFKNYTYEEIDEKLKVSKSTIMNVSNALKSGKNGYKKVVEEIIKKQKREKLFLNIDEILLQLSPPKRVGTGGFERKREKGKNIYLRRKKIDLL